MKNPFRYLNKTEWILLLSSLTTVCVCFLCVPEKDYLTLIASLIGVTALIFVAKGLVFGQFLILIFSTFYGIISYIFTYYGEMITYLCMSSPIAIMSIISWIKHPYKNSAEVEVHKVTKKQIAWLAALCIVVTTAFFFILRALGNANLVFSTISVATSFVAASLTFLRSPYYALGYVLNDVILIILWTLATIETVSYFPMIICFVTFLVNDLYGFINWKRMQKRQNENA